MDTKKFKVRFYTGQVGADGLQGRVSEVFAQMVRDNSCPVIKMAGGLSYEMRDLEAFGHGAAYRGVFAKFRSDDLPHVGAPGGEERNLEIAEHEGLLEKNYFLYYRKHELLVYQENANGSLVGRLSEYLSYHINLTTLFRPVLQPDATKRLLRGDVKPLSLELSFARPTNAEWYPPDQFGRELLELMNSAAGASVHIRLTGAGRGAFRQPLTQRVKRAAANLLSGVDMKVARLQVDEDGVQHPIDLIADRLFSQVVVDMAGRYPVPASMYSNLLEAKNEHDSALEDIFGAAGNVLD